MKAKLPVGILVGLLFVASIDRVPDPPAINSHGVSSIMLTNQVVAKGRTCESQPLSSFSSVPLFQVRWNAYRSIRIPKVPRDEIITAGYATNPSPPPGSRIFRT